MITGRPSPTPGYHFLSLDVRFVRLLTAPPCLHRSQWSYCSLGIFKECQVWLPDWGYGWALHGLARRSSSSGPYFFSQYWNAWVGYCNSLVLQRGPFLLRLLSQIIPSWSYSESVWFPVSQKRRLRLLPRWWPHRETRPAVRFPPLTLPQWLPSLISSAVELSHQNSSRLCLSYGTVTAPCLLASRRSYFSTRWTSVAEPWTEQLLSCFS